MGAFLGMLWCFERLFLKSSSGRNRYNVLGTYSVKDAELITITNDAYINSDMLGGCPRIVIVARESHFEADFLII